MLERDQILEVLRHQDGLLRSRFKVKTLGLFGSYVRGEQNVSSDIDLLVEFQETVSLFDFIRLEDFLSDLFGHKVDLVMKNALKPRIGERILSEVAYP